jgi:hypothetical protein
VQSSASGFLCWRCGRWPTNGRTISSGNNGTLLSTAQSFLSGSYIATLMSALWNTTSHRQATQESNILPIFTVRFSRFFNDYSLWRPFCVGELKNFFLWRRRVVDTDITAGYIDVKAVTILLLRRGCTDLERLAYLAIKFCAVALVVHFTHMRRIQSADPHSSLQNLWSWVWTCFLAPVGS